MAGPPRLGAQELARHVAGWTDGRGRLYVLLADAIAGSIAQGEIPASALLPPERALAAALPAGRGTVAAAYRLLATRGIVTRRRGSGTRVRESWMPSARVRELEAGLRARQLASHVLDEPMGIMDVAISVLDDLDGLPTDAWSIAPADLLAAGEGHGYLPFGVLELRQRLADLADDATTEEIVVTSGAQQAIELAARSLVAPGDLVAIEEPAYPGAIDVYVRAGARLAPIPTDDGGPRVEPLTSLLAEQDVRVVHLAPTAANPTGVVTAPGRRAAIAAALASSDAWLVEDNSLQFLTETDPPPPIASLLGDARTVTIGSLSKLYWGGLRLGWLRAPTALVALIGQLRSATDLGLAVLPQVAACRLLDSSERVAAARRSERTRRADVLLDQLARKVPELDATRPDGGLSLWIPLPEGSGDDLVAVARCHGLGILPGSACSLEGGGDQHVRISSWIRPELAPVVASRLAAAWRAYRCAA